MFKENRISLTGQDLYIRLSGEDLIETRSNKDRAIHLVKNSIPNTISFFCFYLSTTISFSILSAHSSSNTELLAACGIGNSILVSAFYSTLYCLNTAVLNLGSQAIGGGKYELMGYTLHRAMIINLSLMVPLGLLISNSEGLLVGVGLDPQISALAVKYVNDMLIATSFSVIFNTLHYYLIAQGIFYPQVVLLSTSVVVHYCLSMFLIGCGIDFYKAVICSKTTVEFLNVVAIVIYISHRKDLARTWFKPNGKSFRRIISQLKTGLEGGSITYFEILVLEIITFFSGMMESSQVAAQAAFVNFAYIISSPPVGIGNTLAAIVSEKIGEGSKMETVGYIRTGVIVIMSIGVAAIIGVHSCTDFLVQVYTSDPDVVPILKSLLLLYPIFMLFDYLMQVISGILRSLGLERFASISYFVVYYFVSIPISYLLGIKLKMGALGLMMGIGIGTAIVCCLGMYMIFFKVDIEQQIKAIRRRLRHFDEQATTIAPSLVIELKDIESIHCNTEERKSVSEK